MPQAIAVDDGLDRLLSRALNNPDTQFQPWTLGLFVNDLVPTRDTVLNDLEEANWAGYSRRSLDPNQWQAITVVDHVAKAVWGTAPLAWTNNSGADVTNYGYWIYSLSYSELMFVQRFDDVDIRAVPSGGQIKIQPVIWAQSIFAG